MSAVTLFKTVFDKKPHYSSASKVLEQFRNGPKQLDLIAQIRASSDSEERETLKKQLAVVCFGGKFSERKAAALIEPSRLVILDFDDVSKIEVKRRELMAIPYVYSVFMSPSGEGLKALVKVASDNYVGHWMALAKEISGVDASGKDVCRACFYSYDPVLYINEKADIYTKVIETVYNDEQKLEKLKKWLENKGDRFVSGNRNNFLAKLAGAMNRFGMTAEFALKTFERDYVQGTDFSLQEAKTVVRSIYTNYAEFHNTASFDESFGEARVTEVLSSELPSSDAIYLNDVAADLIKDYEVGTAVATTTYFPSIDLIFRPLRGDLNVLGGIGNHGKALSTDTDIPTPNGWVKMGNIKVGDKVFDETGKQCDVTAVTDVQHNRPCYKIIFSDNSEVIADEQHLWLTETDKSLRSARCARKNKRDKPRDIKRNGIDQSFKRTFASIVTTKEIAETLYAKHKTRKIRNHAVGFAQAIICDKKSLLIPPYVLGAWLGDGSSAAGVITSGDPDVIKKIKTFGYEVTARKTRYSYGIYGLLVQLRALSLLKNKHVPSLYLRGSIAQREELLAGLMDTDGYSGNGGMCEYVSVRKRLAYDVFELITSLGIKATIHEGDAKPYGRVVSKKYRIFFKCSRNVFFLKRKAATCSTSLKNKLRVIKECAAVESVPVRCIEVNSPSRLYLCTKSFIPTHNSAIAKQMDLVTSVKEARRHAWFGPEEFPPLFWYRELMRSYVGKPLEKSEPNRMTELEYRQAMEFIRSHFVYIYPKTMPTPDYLLERFAEVIIKDGITSITVDPWNQLMHVMQKRDDIYLAETLTNFERFAQQQNIYLRIIAHPNRTVKKEDGNYACPDVYDLNGGPVWNARATNICMYHRPFWGTDKSDPAAEFHSKKIKRQMISGLPGMAAIDYDRRTGRFYDNGFNPLDN